MFIGCLKQSGWCQEAIVLQKYFEIHGIRVKVCKLYKWVFGSSLAKKSIYTATPPTVNP